jgi:hypothetical protein
LSVTQRKPNHTISVGNRHRLQHRGIDDAENGRVGSNAQGEDYNYDGREPGRFGERPQSLPQMLNHA